MLRNEFLFSSASAAAAAGIGTVGAGRAALGFEKAMGAADEDAGGKGDDGDADDNCDHAFSSFERNGADR